MTPSLLFSVCESVYQQFHRREYISPDPLEVVLQFPRPDDREIVGFLASSLALGRVDGIIGAASWIASKLEHPAEALRAMDDQDIKVMCRPFVYRFFTGYHLAGLLIGMKRVLVEYGSLEECFAAGVASSGEDGSPGARALRGLARLVKEITAAADGRLNGSILVARPDRGSACKRLLLFLRWMVRSDSVDPGGWTVLNPSDLLVPVDTHMLTISRLLGLTSATTASLRVSGELTASFAGFQREDPVRYDFSLTRLGIHPEGKLSAIRKSIEDGPTGLPV